MESSLISYRYQPLPFIHLSCRHRWKGSTFFLFKRLSDRDKPEGKTRWRKNILCYSQDRESGPDFRETAVTEYLQKNLLFRLFGPLWVVLRKWPDFSQAIKRRAEGPSTLLKILMVATRHAFFKPGTSAQHRHKRGRRTLFHQACDIPSTAN